MVMETSLGSVAKSRLSSAVSLNGSKFGRRIYYDEPVTASAIGAPPPISGAGQSLSESGKKGRASPGSHPPRCQVEGCELDLSDAKLYHSKHKVCPTHSKSPKVIVRGLQCRFCQQCSRFHQLSEFDQGKRSCRRRLAGHNARRRKPPPQTFLPSCYESSSGCGGIMVDFTAYSMTNGKDSWPIPRSKECAPVTRSTAPHQRLHNSYNLPPSHFLVQSSATRVGFSSLTNPLEGCHAAGTNSSCALSLLSSQPLDSGNKDPGMGSNGLIDAEGQPMAQLKMPYAAVVGPYSDAPWCVKGIDSCTGSLAMPSSLGNNQFSDRLGLWQQHRRQYMELDYSKDYDAATQHINWSL